MKKRFIIILTMLLILTLGCTSGVFAFAQNKAAESSAAWRITAQSGVSEAHNAKGVSTVTASSGGGFVAGTPIKFAYDTKVNFEEGARFRYVIPTSSDMDISGDARVNGSNYIRFTALNDAGKGFEVQIYALRTAAESNEKIKMQVDVFYLDPAITKKGKFTDVGKELLESFDTYTSVDGEFHTIDLHRENNWWMIGIDGLTAIPVPKLSTVDLSASTVEFEYFTKTKSDFSFKVYPFDEQIKNYVVDDFLTFGSTIRTELEDDTIRYKIADKRAEAFSGSEIRYREQFISTVGYDVRKPINIEYSYDVSNASAVWYAIGLGRPGVVDSIERVRYNVFGYTDSTHTGAKDEKFGAYSDKIANDNDGIMFQTTTGLAQPTFRDQNSRTSPYTTNSPSKGYAGRSSIDIVTFIVKEDGTDMYMNGTLIFDKLVTKLSDFEDSNYMAYPYLHFFEDNASAAKGNTVVIKGINAAKRTDDADLKVVGNSNKDVEVGIDNFDNGTIKLYDYQLVNEKNTLTEIDSSLYSFDEANKKLTIKYGYFNGKDYDVYKVYAKNNSGSEEISIRFSDPALTTQPPTTEKDTYYWKEKAGESDLVVNMDIKNGTFVSFAGGGITKTNYVYTPSENSSAGTIAISKEFLNGKKAGTFTFTIKTTNIENEEFQVQFKVVINKTGLPDAGEPPIEETPPAPEAKGCGGYVALPIAILAVLSLGVCALFIRRKKV